MEHQDMSKTDLLALVRTKLANERTFLAYFRTFIVFLSSGFAILKLEILQSLKALGYFFIIISFIVVVIGLLRFFYVKKRINSYYD
jgi:putative membrane protein